MKNLVRPGKKWLSSSPGFTLAELMVAMAVGSFVMSGVFAVWTQLFSVTATNSNYMVALRQVQNSGGWITRDALMAQGVYEMASTQLNGGITDTETTITVDSTAGFPSSGVISIEDELIQYTGKSDTQFTGGTRGSSNAAAHGDGESVTVFVTLNWTEWSGEQHQAVYNMKQISRELVRSHFTDGTLQDSAVVARAIDLAGTTSVWDYDEKQLTLVIAARVSGYVQGKHGLQSETANRTYRVHPRPFF